MKTFNLKIYSLGGQKIRSAVTNLEKDLEERQDLFFTSLVKYDGVIKGGMVETNIVISTEKGKTPFFDRANLCIFLTEITNPIPADEYLTVQNLEELNLLEKLKGI